MTAINMLWAGQASNPSDEWYQKADLPSPGWQDQLFNFQAPEQNENIGPLFKKKIIKNYS